MKKLLAFMLVAAIGCGDDDGAPTHDDDARDASTSSSGTGAKGAGTGGAGASADGGRGGAAEQASAGRSGENVKKREVPRLYPLVRASTPTELIGDASFQAQAYMIQPSGGVGVLPQALGGAINLAVAVRERFYSMGPTALLRIVKDLDDRVAGLETDPDKHPCLGAAPVERIFALPGGQQFVVRLQCLQNFGNPGDPGAGWVAFGFASPGGGAVDADAGMDGDGGVEDAREAFYLVEGQEGGMGGAYRVQGDDVEAWIAVADSNAPMNSQVIMHLMTHKMPATSELALAGAGVGFCSAHLKTSTDFIFIEGKTNGAPPPGTPMMPGVQYCDDARAGCFAVSDLATELSGDDAHCRPISSSFQIRGRLDASADAEANVTPSSIYMYFKQRPTGVTAF